jgi:hypothetical protein
MPPTAVWKPPLRLNRSNLCFQPEVLGVFA